MSRGVDIHFAGDPTVLANIPGRGIVDCAGDTVPTDGTAGFATGCIFRHLGGSAGTALYVNEGSNTSCDFDAVTVA